MPRFKFRLTPVFCLAALLLIPQLAVAQDVGIYGWPTAGAPGLVESADIKSKIDGTGLVTSTTVHDGLLVAPTLAELQAYDVVLVWSNQAMEDPVNVGNVLADYVDLGGGVVLLQGAATSTEEKPTSGRLSRTIQPMRGSSARAKTRSPSPAAAATAAAGAVIGWVSSP